MQLKFYGNEQETTAFCTICKRLKECDSTFEIDYERKSGVTAYLHMGSVFYPQQIDSYDFVDFIMCCASIITDIFDIPYRNNSDNNLCAIGDRIYDIIGSKQIEGIPLLIEYIRQITQKELK